MASAKYTLDTQLGGLVIIEIEHLGSYKRARFLERWMHERIDETIVKSTMLSIIEIWHKFEPSKSDRAICAELAEESVEDSDFTISLEKS